MAQPTTRRRPRVMDAPPERTNMGLDDRMLELYRAKLAADEADRVLAEKKKNMLTALQNANLTQHTLSGEGDRPETVAKIATRKTNTVDFSKFAKKVSPEELAEAGSVSLTNAKKFLSGNDLDSIVTTSMSAPFLDFKTKGKRT